MNKKFLKQVLGMFCAGLIAICAFGGCAENGCNSEESTSLSAAVPSAELGEGEKEFCVEVVGSDNAKTSFAIHTDASTVGEALLELEFIDGEQGPYGLYVKTVNGITLDYNKDKMYWAFYVDGEYATKGVDETEIDEACVYSFRAEK